VGSRWGIYAHNALSGADSTQRFHMVEVVEVDAVTSQARLLDEPPIKPLVPGLRAFEEYHDYGEMRLHIAILRLSDVSEAELQVYLLPPRQMIDRDSPVPQLGQLSEPVWAVVGEHGRLVMPIHSVGLASSTSTVLENLEKAARYSYGLMASNLADSGSGS
jgi:hypothetical protein